MALLMTVTIVFNTFSGTAFATETGEAGTVVSSESETTASETDSEAEVETEAEAETEAETETSTEEDTEGSTEASTEESIEGVTEEATTEDTTETATEESAVDETEESGEDAAQASTEASAEETTEEVTTGETTEEDTTEDVTAEEATEEDTTEEDTTEEATEEDTTEEVTTEEATEADTTEEATTEETTEESTEEIVEETLGAAGGVALLAGIEVYATGGETIYVLAGGDFQEAGDHANSAANVTNILAQISQKYTTMDGFLFIGDYDCETHNDATETANGITALMGAVQGSYSNLNDENSVLVQGNHDYMDSRIDATGGHNFDDYSAYVLNEDDYPNGGGTQSGVQNLANNLKTWLDGKIAEDYSAPIFIVSHLPLAFTPRTVTQGDAKYAKYIFDVLNEAGANGLNIIFLHGHDHAYGPDNYMGGEAIYLAEGDKICIAEAGSTSAWTEETLNFTYMNAGYTGYYSDAFTYNATAGTDKLTMTVFAITDNEVTVERYSANGRYNLKSAGYDGSYSNTSVTNKSLGLPTYSAVYASPQTIELVDASSDGTESGTIGEYVGVSSLVEDVTTSGNEWVTITAATNGTEGSDPTYQYVLDTDGIDYGSDNKYLIVARNAAYLLDAGSGVAVTISSDGKTATTSTTSYEYYFTTDGLITRDGTNTLYQQNWGIHVGNVSGSNLNGFTNLGNGYYRIYDTDGTERSLYWYGDSWTVTGSDHENTNYSVRLYKYSQTIAGSDATPGNNGLYGYLDGELRYEVASGTSAADALAAVKAGIAIKYTYYEDFSNVGDYADDGDGMTWTLDSAYDGTTPGDYAVTIAYNGTVLGTASVVVPATTTYYIAEGDGLYLVDMNTSADDALAAVKAGITVSSAADANGTDKTTIDDSQVTWNWVDKYDATNYGPYTVEILYNGASLGTVEVKVNVQHETEIAEGWTHVGTSSTTYKYVLDTDGYETGSNNRYLFVASNAAYAMDEDGSGVVPVTFNDDETEAIVDSRDYEWYITTYRSGRTTYYPITKNGSTWIYHENYGMHVGTNDNGYWSINENDQDEGLYRFSNVDGSTWYLYYDSADRRMEVSTSSSNRVRLYKYDGEIDGGDIYAKIEGNTVYTVTQGKSATSALNTVKAGITGYISNNADGSDATELDDSKLTWNWLNKYNGQATGSYWVEISYNNVVLGTVEVKVEPGVVNNYPEYPDEGAVKVNKTATGVDFQSSGIAQIELSASGVPIKKGADVILMLDTSSSMTSHTVTGTEKTRAAVLEESLAKLIAQFKTPGDDGELLDIRVAIADFNGFYGENQSASGTAYDRDAADMMSDDIYYNAASEAQVYTGDGTLGAGAFVDAADLANSYTLNYTSGTNYDYAMDAIYQMGTAIKEANGNEDRDLFVIFMSDGAAMQWNYYHSQGASSLWNNWITGAWGADDLTTANLNCTTHAYYYDEVDHNGDGMKNEHRMANAIKGDPSEEYEVIRKTNNLGTATGETNMYMVPGLGAKMFSISFDAQTDTNVTEESMDKSIETLASEQTDTTKYYYKVTSADELSAAFDVIGAEIAYAANNARFVDQIGDNFNLQLKTSTYTVVDGDTTTTKTLAPVIEILTYDIYTRQDYLDGIITEDKIGDRKGTYTLNEVIKFSDDGTKAYSNLIDVDGDGIYGVTVNSDGTYTISDIDDNIIGADGVIYAKTFLYNTGATDVTITGVDIPTGTTSAKLTTGSTAVVPSETFYWKMGTVQTSELAMRYYVYLDGSMEGTKEAGSYQTNEFAILYYDNHLGNPCYIETVSPVIAWKEANVSYAFYLVDENGNIIVNQTTGQTGSFANKIAVTNPVVYETVLLNNGEEVSSIDIASLGVLPEGYTLYDYDGTNGATYTVQINSNTTGSWEITTVKDVHTTYVMQYDPNDASAYSNALTNGTVGDDYTHTVVWFAVLWKVQALPDTVVIDYGLPVDISVLTNDMFGENGKLAGVGAYSDSLNLDGYDTALATGFGSSYTGTYGIATADTTTGKVRYTPSNMQMNGYEKFAYAVNYTGTTNPGYYYDTVTVIPATTIYYEDDFLTYTASNTEWVDEGTAVESAIQDEDRPGKYSLTDANNIYGYDAVNLGMSTFSLGTAKTVHVDADSYATASFTFYGTGFDVIGMTSNTTGVIAVKVVTNQEVTIGETTYAAGEAVANKFVNTYYGYTYQGGEWTATPDTDNALYQIPVLQIEQLPYGNYTVTITATYMTALDKTTADGYDLYLDAVRIYDPANDGAADGTTDTTIEDAYKADGEGWPSYIELRNKLIAANSFDNVANDALTTDMDGLVFIDGDLSVGDVQIKDYKSYGPNNEVYLAPGQRVAFMLSTPTNIANVHIGIKSADGQTATYTITNIAKASNTETGVEAGDYYGAKTATVNTTTDMYYDLTGWKNDIIVISNTGDRYDTTGIISLTNIKSTYTSDPNGTATADAYGLNTASVDEVPAGNETSVYMTASAATLTLRSLNRSVVEETPEETTPEETTPEETTGEEVTPEETTTEEETVEETTTEEVTTEETTTEETTSEEATTEEETDTEETTSEEATTEGETPEETTPEETAPEYTEAEKFDPEKLTVKLSSNSVKVGSTVVVTVQTGSDVNALSVNGRAVERYIENRWTKTRTWIVTVKASEAGEMDIEVIAYDADSVASEPVVETVTVTAKSQNLLDKIFGWLFR